MTNETVRRRHVFFLSGFDPKGAAYYHRLYATGATQRNSRPGSECMVGPRERTNDTHVQQWQIRWTEGTAEKAEPTVETIFEFLSWDDLVRAHWPRDVSSVAAGAWRAYLAALSSGTSLIKVWRQSRRTLVALAYPALFWLLSGSVALLLAWLVAWLGMRVAAGSTWPYPLVLALVTAGAGLAGGGVWSAALALERRLHTSWLLRIYDFTNLWAKGRLPDLEQRLAAMAQRVMQRLKKHDADEVLLVGYSVGSMLTTSVLARVVTLLQQWPEAERQRAIGRLSMLTLGQCLPLLAFMPRADDFRLALRTVALAPGLRWTDYSSPGDWGSFALVDPIAMCNLAPPQGPSLKPCMRSPRFHTLFEPTEYARLKRDKRRLHLQYLMPTPLAGAYDYFRITAGPLRLQCHAKSDPHTEAPA
jgi:hypothetical protein